MTALSPTPLFDWTPPRWMAERDSAMAQVEANAGPNFKAEALKFIVKFLRENGDQSGEAISAACIKAGIKPHDSRAFGPVMKALLADKLIVRVGECARTFGHGSRGGSIYRITK